MNLIFVSLTTRYFTFSTCNQQQQNIKNIDKSEEEENTTASVIENIKTY